MPDFLLELGTEEIPAGYIQLALRQGVAFFQTYLKEQQLSYKDIKEYATPRRMVFFITDLPKTQADIKKEIIGPPSSIAFGNNNKPTSAYNGFIKRYNLSSSDVKIKEMPKGKVCYASIIIKGEEIEKILAESIIALIKSLSLPKSMWWSDKTLNFARPLRYILAIFDKKPIKVNLPGVISGNKTYGHPFISHRSITVNSANFEIYQGLLKTAKVIVDQDERRNIIEKGIQGIIQKYDATCNEPELLDEVVNLVEYPTVIECEFDESFLKLPEAVIESAMKLHQRYFPLKDKNGRLLSRFIVVSNNPDSKNSSLIKEGNERVLKARLSDAVFFWEQDRKISLSEYAKRLDSITFLGKLGTMADKSKRLEELALFIADNWCTDNDKEIIERSAKLCKADLLTGMLGEFPDLQGIMGYEYALTSGESEAVAQTIKEHYQPRFTQDSLPQTSAGICLSLAEKIDNLADCFTIGLKPSGIHDPYGLRRQAIGIIKIIIATKLNISLNKIWDKTMELLVSSVSLSAREIAKSAYPWVKELWETVAKTHQLLDNYRKQIKNELNRFIDARFYQILVEEIGIDSNIYNAVIRPSESEEPQVDKLYNVSIRINTLQNLSEESFWDELVEVVERTYNITKNTKVDGEVNETLLKEKEEIELWNAYKDNKNAIQKLIDTEQYEEASRLYHNVFAKPAHIFFEKVFVNVDDTALKNNRILLNKKINQLYSSQIADLSKIPRKR